MRTPVIFKNIFLPLIVVCWIRIVGVDVADVDAVDVFVGVSVVNLNNKQLISRLSDFCLCMPRTGHL